MENLPVEMKLKIFKELTIYEQLGLRLVNRKCKSIIDQYFKIENLAVGCNKSPFFFDYFDQDKLIDCIFINKIKISEVDLSQKIFVKVRRIVFLNSISSDCTTLVNQLCKLENLTSLDINRFSKIDNESVYCPYLTHLRLDAISCEFSDLIEFIAPKLKNLKLKIFKYDFKRIKFLHPESIQKLEIGWFDYHFLEKCVNLEYLHCDQVDKFFNKEYYASEILKNLLNLKEIHILQGALLMENLKKQKIKQNKNELELFYGYVNLQNNECVLSDLYHPCKKNQIEIWLENQPNLAGSFVSLNKLKYESIERYSDKLNDEFLMKFSDLNYILIEEKLESFKPLINLLKKCKKIKSISFYKLKSIQIDDYQEFFDNHLPFLCPKLKFLEFYQSKTYGKLDFRFLLDFEILSDVFLNDIFITKKLLKLIFEKKNVHDMAVKIEGFEDSYEIDFDNKKCSYGCKEFKFKNIDQLCIMLKKE